MSNSVFGKSMETYRRENYKLDYSFERSKEIDRNPLIDLRRKEVMCDKPIYIGASIYLDLSKVQMMDFHYSVAHKNFEEIKNVIHSNTHSFVYSTQREDLYKRG